MNFLKKTLNMQRVLNLFLIILCALVLLPFLMLVSISLSNEKDIMDFGYSLVPKQFDLSAYKWIFKESAGILQAYKITAVFSFVYMVLSTGLMTMLAYALSRRIFKARNKVSFALFFTQLFSGGLVPTYLLITKYLHLDDTIWVYILPGLVSPWYVFMLRTSLADVPEELHEAARIDGCKEFFIFAGIYVPLIKPAIATVMLMSFLAKWNDWNTALLYISDQKLVSLQYYLQRIMENIKFLQSSESGISSMINTADIPSETVRMAMAVCVAGPALFIFPFFQKYFVKGLTVGGVKG